MTKAEQMYEALQALPEPERLRLVERVIHALADTASTKARPPENRSLLGLWASEPDLVDEMVEDIMTSREKRSWRRPDE